MIDETPKYAISVAAEFVGMHPQTLRLYETRRLVVPAPLGRRAAALLRRRPRAPRERQGAHDGARPQPLGRRARAARSSRR